MGTAEGRGYLVADVLANPKVVKLFEFVGLEVYRTRLAKRFELWRIYIQSFVKMILI